MVHPPFFNEHAYKKQRFPEKGYLCNRTGKNARCFFRKYPYTMRRNKETAVTYHTDGRNKNGKNFDRIFFTGG